MKVLIDNGYIVSYALIGELVGGIEVSAPVDINDLRHFESNFTAYKVVGGSLEFDEAKSEELKTDSLREELRQRRDVECFPFVDRGRFWYDSLTAEQLQELNSFYLAWLDVTETLAPPERPSWLT